MQLSTPSPPYYKGNTPDLQSADIGKFAMEQSAILTQLQELAGTPNLKNGDDWRPVVDAGMQYVDVRCSHPIAETSTPDPAGSEITVLCLRSRRNQKYGKGGKRRPRTNPTGMHLFPTSPAIRQDHSAALILVCQQPFG